MGFASALAAAGRAAARAAGSEVKLTRGAVTIDCVPALKGGYVAELVDPISGVVTRIDSQDWLLLATDYDFGDGPVEPARGDQVVIEETDGEHVYELLEIDGQPGWRWSDPWKTRLRLHTKEIAKP